MRRAVFALLLVVLSSSVHASDFPSWLVTTISPYQTGGTSDIIARVLAERLQARRGQTVIVENKPGANGGLGVNAVANAAPDGHTLLAVASSALTLNPLFYEKFG